MVAHNRKYKDGQRINGKIIISYNLDKKSYKAKCLKCGNKKHMDLNTLERYKKGCPTCRLTNRTIAVKNKIAIVLEMYFGRQMMIKDISLSVGLGYDSVLYFINIHGFGNGEKTFKRLKSAV